MDRPKSVVRVIRGVAGRAATGGALALQLLRATRIQVQPESIRIFFAFIFFPLLSLPLLSMLNPNCARTWRLWGGARVQIGPLRCGQIRRQFGSGKKISLSRFNPEKLEKKVFFGKICMDSG